MNNFLANQLRILSMITNGIAETTQNKVDKNIAKTVDDLLMKTETETLSPEDMQKFVEMNTLRRIEK